MSRRDRGGHADALTRDQRRRNEKPPSACGISPHLTAGGEGILFSPRASGGRCHVVTEGGTPRAHPLSPRERARVRAHHLLQCPHRPLPSPQDIHSLRECNFDAPPANNRLRSRSPIREDHDVRTTHMGRSMRGRGLRRSPTRPRTASGKRGGKLHRMESEGAIGQRDSAHPVSHRAHAPGEWIQAPLPAQSRTPMREHSAQ